MTILQVIMRKLTSVLAIIFAFITCDFNELNAQFDIAQGMTPEQYVNMYCWVRCYCNKCSIY